MEGRAFAAGVLSLVFAATSLAQEIPGYSIVPLLEPPRIPYQSLPNRMERQARWMERNFPRLERNRYSDIQTTVHELVDTILKQRAIEGRAEFSGEERRMLHTLYGWETQLGVYGADLLATHFADPDSPSSAAGEEPPAPFRVSLAYPYMVVSADDTPWRLRFPFYFTIRNLVQTDVPSGGTISVVTISSSFAMAYGDAGYSTAGITFAHSSDADAEAFDAKWLSNYGMSAADEDEPPLPGTRNFQVTEPRLSVHMESTLFRDATGSYAFTYVARFGVNQVNRVNYLDFMRSVIEVNESEAVEP